MRRPFADRTGCRCLPGSPCKTPSSPVHRLPLPCPGDVAASRAAPVSVRSLFSPSPALCGHGPLVPVISAASGSPNGAAKVESGTVLDRKPEASVDSQVWCSSLVRCTCVRPADRLEEFRFPRCDAEAAAAERSAGTWPVSEVSLGTLTSVPAAVALAKRQR